MGLLDDLKRILGQHAPIPTPPPSTQTSNPTPHKPAAAATPGEGIASTKPDADEAYQTHNLGPFKATLLTVHDPFVTDVRNGHCSDAYLRGDERLLAFEFRLEHGGTSEDPVKIGGHKLHLFDDFDHIHEPLGLDSRSRSPRLVEGFLLPGGAARGWVTFALDWARQPKRVQMFTGYLGEGVCCWDLPPMSDEDWAHHRHNHRSERLAGTTEAVLVDKRAAISELEAQAALAELLLTRQAELSELEARAAQAREVLHRLAVLEASLGPDDLYEEDDEGM
ncbi:MAG: hypothetical protein AAFX99_16405 [Myxococcota bacterium]